MGMNDDIKKFPVYILYAGRLQTAEWVHDVGTYDHYNWQMHHYIKQQTWKRNEKKLRAQGVEQKLILLPTQCHVDLHNCVSDFEEKWGIKRSELLYGAERWE